LLNELGQLGIRIQQGSIQCKGRRPALGGRAAGRSEPARNERRGGAIRKHLFFGSVVQCRLQRMERSLCLQRNVSRLQ
jgi:hypothetical protein